MLEQYEIKMTDHEAEGSKYLLIAYNCFDRLNSISFKDILHFNSRSVARNAIASFPYSAIFVIIFTHLENCQRLY